MKEVDLIYILKKNYMVVLNDKYVRDNLDMTSL